MSVLVTGGAGYIGSVVGEQLINNGYHVVIFDDLSNGRIENVPSEAEFFNVNIIDQDFVSDIFKKYHFESVMHFAASANVPDSVTNPKLYYENNIIGSLTLLNKILEFEIPIFIFSSSAAVYGKPNTYVIEEDIPLNPITPYGRSKLFIERIIQDYCKAYDLKSVIFRYFCAAGATKLHGEARKEKETHLIPLIIDSVIGINDFFTVYGDDFQTEDGTGVRDYLHVSDIANAHILGMEQIGNLPHKSEIFNLGSNKGYSVLEVVRETENFFGQNICYKVGPKRYGDPPILIAGNKKVHNLLGWKPKYSLYQIIESTYNWRCKNVNVVKK